MDYHPRTDQPDHNTDRQINRQPTRDHGQPETNTYRPEQFLRDGDDPCPVSRYPPNTSSAAKAVAHTADTIESATQSASFGRDSAAEI